MIVDLLSLEGGKSTITMSRLGGVRGVVASSMASTVLASPLAKVRLPTVPIAKPISRPLTALAVADHDLVHVGEPGRVGG